MSWDELLPIYLEVLRAATIPLAILILITGVDDLFVDLVYWSRRLKSGVTSALRRPFPEPPPLDLAVEKPLVIMVPAWQEHGVICQMAELAASTLDYRNYHLFVGTYPNDPQTQADVDAVAQRFPNVHKVVCAKPGPSSKADCLNNILGAILAFEKQSGLSFEGFILHDSEDVLAPMELRLFSSLVSRKDLIQVPVYPLARRWDDFTSGHYLDEFAETHGKDIVVREALAQQVPSAGVGTCFSRRAILALQAAGEGVAFDAQSLTEDYDIALRLKAYGMSETFVRHRTSAWDWRSLAWTGLRRGPQVHVLSVREFFPDTLAAAVRQKSRWIIGIVFQGYRRHGWSGSLVLNYFLWRDRKGALVSLLGFMAMLILLQLGLLWGYAVVAQKPLPQVFTGEDWLVVLLAINFWLIANRMVQRIVFVSAEYGVVQGLLSVPRLAWGNLINFLATWRAIRQVLRAGDAYRVRWDKTRHDFPGMAPASSTLPLQEAVPAAPPAVTGAGEALTRPLMPPVAAGATIVSLAARREAIQPRADRGQVPVRMSWRNSALTTAPPHIDSLSLSLPSASDGQTRQHR